MKLSFFKENIQQNFIRPPQVPQGRIGYVDLAKGICIILVVVYHMLVFTDSGIDIPNLGSLRMPLYFILSGLFFKDYGGWLGFTERKINRILVPFIFFWGAMGLLFTVVLPALVWGKVEVEKVITGLFTRNLTNVSSWFLLSLFEANLIFAALMLHVRREWVRGAVCALCSMAGCLLFLAGVRLPLFLDSTLSAMPFFYFGYFLRRYTTFLTSRSLLRDLLIALLGIGISYMFWFLEGNHHIDFYPNIWQSNPAICITSSVCFVTGVLSLCKWIVWLPVVSYMGRYSIIILGFHMPVHMATSVVWHSLALPPVSPWVWSAIILAICWLAIPLSRLLIPSLTAQNDGFVRLPRILKRRETPA